MKYEILNNNIAVSNFKQTGNKANFMNNQNI